jgi:predicted ATPase
MMVFEWGRVSMSPRPLLKRVVIQNYKSIAFCDVPLGPLNFLVGLNGSGKSNFVDALRFCRDALRKSFDQAFMDRQSSIQLLSHIPLQAEPGFGMGVELVLADGRSARYSFSLCKQKSRGFAVRREECVVSSSDGGDPVTFSVDSGQVQTSFGGPPALSDGQLYLVHAAGAPEVRPVYDALANMEFYDPDPRKMKVSFLDSSGRPGVLDANGGNAPSVFSRIDDEDHDVGVRIQEYMGRILPGLESIEAEKLDSTYNLLRFHERAQNIVGLTANSMSDGTLRALAILIALFQRGQGSATPSLVAIEEPETGIHPAAAGVLLDGLIERSNFVQVLVTSHSADLLDNKDLPSDAILSVEMSAGGTRIGRLDAASRSILKKRLFTAGELLRMDDLHPEPADVKQQDDLSLVFDKA